ncbi:FUSC family protein [Streptomyces sp. NBC_01264]|uniref:FUSC family protein n=1 Tax=Streptomyces sp. NBC_01264 TaxID=2903804 RepID=UPI00225661CC|nr:FUSC family protein [Streptomyces sp. NBC_01264]MCX4781672.1 FUSC family protein [Streptomyces sp. NBC_01264]
MNSPAARTKRTGRARDILVAEGPLAARIVVTVVAAWQTALWLGADQPPVYAAVVPLVALRGDSMTALTTSLQRVLGVVAGVCIGIAVLNVLHPSTAALALVVALGLAAGMVLRAGGSLNVQVAASSLLVFASTSPDAYALHRLWETAAGAAVTILFAPLLWPPDPRRTLATLTVDSRTRLIQALTRTTAILGTDAGAVRDNLAAVTSDIEAIHGHAVRAREAERAMRFNPLRRRHRDTVAHLTRAVITTDRLTPHLAVLAGETVAFTGRDDLASVLTNARRYLPGLAASTVEAITATLDGANSQQARTTARESLAAYARADSHPAAAVLRRPFQRILDDLEQHLAP